MRNNINLMLRSPYVPLSHTCESYHEVLHGLEKGLLIYPPSMKWHLKPAMSLKDKKETLQLDAFPQRRESESEENFKQWMKDSAVDNRYSEWMWRVGQHHKQMDLEGWYPFFATLTVDDNLTMPPPKWEEQIDRETGKPVMVNVGGLGMTKREMWQDGREWTKWKRAIANQAAKAMGHKPPHKSGAPESDYAQFFGMLEHGASGVHDHMHVLFWMREIPAGWKRCPNRGIIRPELRKKQQCKPAERFWKWCQPENRPVLYFRSASDIWSRLHFVIPIRKKTGLPLKLYPKEMAGNYFVKYMKKGENKAWPHRVKATRNLGLMKLKDLLDRLHPKTVQALTWRPRTHDMSITLAAIHTVPPVLLRRLAKLTHFSKRWENGSLDFDRVLSETNDVFKAMLRSVQDGARPHKMGSAQRYAWVSQHLPVPDGYCDKKLKRAHLKLQNIAPANDWRPVACLGANST